MQKQRPIEWVELMTMWLRILRNILGSTSDPTWSTRFHLSEAVRTVADWLCGSMLQCLARWSLRKVASKGHQSVLVTTPRHPKNPRSLSLSPKWRLD